MRIAYVCTDRGIRWGGDKGAAVHVQELVAALAEAGADVLLVLAGTAPDVPAPPAGVRLELLPEHAPAAWLRDRLERFRPVVVYERLALYSTAASDAARSLGIPHVVELNAPLPEEAARYRGLSDTRAAARAEAAVLTGAAVVLPVSRPLADYAAERGARRVELVPNAVCIDRFPGPRARSGPPAAVFAGALRPWHGVETIAAAWHMLGSAAPRLVVLGDGPGRDVLAAAGGEIAGVVAHERVPALLADCDIGLAPYARDAPRYFSPLKLFEYLAAGLATVAGDLPAVTDVVDDDTAVVIPQGDADALACAVAALAADPARRRRLGRNGRALVAAEHTWAMRAERVLALAGELAATGLAA